MIRGLLILYFLIVPFVSQEGEGADKYAYDCGPANVAMLVGHYTRIKVTPDSLMDIIGRDRYTHAGELQAMLLNYGLESSVWRFDGIDEVIAYAEHDPVVLLEYNHWILIIGGVGGEIIYHDPMIGPNRFLDKNLMQSRWLWSDMSYQGIVVTKVDYSKVWELRGPRPMPPRKAIRWRY